MCGIVGYLGDREASGILLNGLKKLEYRGYDSAGIAVYSGEKTEIIRAEGKISLGLEKKLLGFSPKGKMGIAHTRWATHGKPTEANAHPHRAGSVTLVHNGIIENHPELRAKLLADGRQLKSETDSELIAHLIDHFMKQGFSMEKAFEKTLHEIRGSFALVILNEQQPDRLYVARQGSPLVIGLGENEIFAASDVAPLLEHTRKVLFLEDGDHGFLQKNGPTLFDEKNRACSRPIQEIQWSPEMAEKSGYKHFMLKEIFEQPFSLADTLTGRIIANGSDVILEGFEKILSSSGDFDYDKIYIVACGTSYHAGLVAKYWLEELTQSLVIVDVASEFRYRHALIDTHTLVVAISQSGETADTLAALRAARQKGARIFSICNVVGSSIPRASDVVAYTQAGPEMGVASTKAFTSQLAMLFLLTLKIAALKKTLSAEQRKEMIGELLKVPTLIKTILRSNERIREMAQAYTMVRTCLFFARGIHFPIALEGALKLKEISYIHAEGYAAGEMKHGPIALLEEGTPVVVLCPQDALYEKVLSNIEEAQARGAFMIGVIHEGDSLLLSKCQHTMGIPKSPGYLVPFLETIPLQLFAYHVADLRGADVDQPRNLAKSVTVE